MPDKEIEEVFLQKFLRHYNSLIGKQYIKDCRPEERKDVAGTYDFLCKDKNSTGDYLAVEEKNLNKSSENARDREEILKFVTEVKRIINEKGVLHDNPYSYTFYLDFEKAPKINEKTKYIQKIAEIVEQAINENKDADGCNGVTFNLEGYKCIKRFSLIGLRRSKTGEVFFPFHAVSHASRDLSDDMFNALSKIIENSNSQLETPKEEGEENGTSDYQLLAGC